ncbi:MAG: hypothetical protein KIH10_10290, partial [Candidatus Freyarchaeota archaeon]|nr:hypothetical protein [Candidatus Jordarchaeia archaeon]
GCYSLNTEYLFPYLIISAYKRQKTYPKNLPNIIGLEAAKNGSRGEEKQDLTVKRTKNKSPGNK